MNRVMLVGAALATVVAVGGCGGGDNSSPGTAVAADSSAVPATPPAAFNDADVLFTQMMVPHHRDAVAMAELAVTRSRNPDLLRLAEQILAVQKPQIDTMVGWLQALEQPTAAPGSDADHGPGEHAVPGTMTFGAMVRLREASGELFDRRFLVGMIAHHRGAIATARTETAQGGGAEAKALAQKMVAGQRAEVDTMRKMLARL